jgi:hypothetical protein
MIWEKRRLRPSAKILSSPREAVIGTMLLIRWEK